MSYNMPTKKLLPKIQYIVCQIVSVFIQQSQQAIQTDVLTGLFYKENNNSGFQKVVVRRNNGWSDWRWLCARKCVGFRSELKKNGHNTDVVALTGWLYGGIPLYFS